MNEREFKQRVLPLASRLYSICIRMLRNEHEAKDCVQDVFVKLWTKKDYLAEVKSIEAFAYTATRNSCLDRLKLKKQMVDIETIASTEDSLIYNGEQYREDDRMLLISKALSKLPELQQKVFNLRDVERLEFDDIANQMATSPEHIRVMLSRARKRIKEIIECELQSKKQVYE